MKTEDILLIGGLGIGAWYLWSKKAEAQPIQELLSGGGGGGGFDLSSLLAGMSLGQGGGGGGFDLSSLLAGMNLGQVKMPDLSNLGGLGNLDMSGLFSGLGDMFKNINLGGAAASGKSIIDTATESIKEAAKSWTDPWGGITDPLHQANVNLAETGKGITGAIGAVTAIGRTAVGGFTNAATFQAPWYSYIFGPVGAVIGGMWKEAGEIVTEKNAAKGTVTLGPEALKTIEQYGGRAAVAEAAQQLAIAQQKAMTPQKQAAAQEVNLGQTKEGPSGLYSGYAQPAAVQKAAIINQQLPKVLQQPIFSPLLPKFGQQRVAYA